MRIGPLSARPEAIRVEDEGAAAAADELPKKPPARSAKSRKSAQASGHPIMHAGRDRFARTRDRAAFLPRDLPSPPAEIGNLNLTTDG
jgi:hypothetical protein